MHMNRSRKKDKKIYVTQVVERGKTKMQVKTNVTGLTEADRRGR